jgi:putative transposase
VLEVSEHVDYDKHDQVGRNRANSHNGTRTKTVLTEIGPVEVPTGPGTAASSRSSWASGSAA